MIEQVLLFCIMNLALCVHTEYVLGGKLAVFFCVHGKNLSLYWDNYSNTSITDISVTGFGLHIRATVVPKQ